MSKKNRERKSKLQAAQAARKLTVGKVLRLMLKSLVFALAVGLLFAALTTLGVPYLDRVWVQFGLVLAVYLVAYPFLMSEFRPRRYERRYEKRR